MLLFHDLMKKQQPSIVNHGHSLNIIVDEVRYLVRHEVLDLCGMSAGVSQCLSMLPSLW